MCKKKIKFVIEMMIIASSNCDDIHICRYECPWVTTYRQGWVEVGVVLVCRRCLGRGRRSWGQSCQLYYSAGRNSITRLNAQKATPPPHSLLCRSYNFFLQKMFPNWSKLNFRSLFRIFAPEAHTRGCKGGRGAFRAISLVILFHPTLYV